ncbi:hypothetical protein KKG71_00865, partial [Patescibacteria group bacterium]|nr:hypothetical protein [Patescibacteria group bacterium]
EFFKEIDEENTSEGELESIGGKSVEVFTLDQPTGDSEYIYFVEHEGKTITIQGEDKAKLESIIESIE